MAETNRYPGVTDHAGSTYLLSQNRVCRYHDRDDSRKSGASTGSLYHHFRNKEAIASAIYIEAMADSFSGLAKGVGGQDPSR